ncbi:unnamed protein product [Moneuplotes crassus]|uniref:Uncharacterized protein n=1 Tax=Euplotes crassus TaxID=5936 RepID=A0AAD1U4D0_EUPCR|nr:unnamed protein product [Moneuplotes crassus]
MLTYRVDNKNYSESSSDDEKCSFSCKQIALFREQNKMFSLKTLRKDPCDKINKFSTLSQNFMAERNQGGNVANLKAPSRNRRRIRLFSHETKPQGRNDTLGIRKFQSIKYSPQKMRIKISRAGDSGSDYDSPKKLRFRRALSPKVQTLSFNIRGSPKKKILAKNSDLSIVLTRAPNLKSKSDPSPLMGNFDSKFLTVMDPNKHIKRERIDSSATNCSSFTPNSPATIMKRIGSPVIQRRYLGEINQKQLVKIDLHSKKMPNIHLSRGDSVKPQRKVPNSKDFQMRVRDIMRMCEN